MTIGQKILNMRKARGWSQEELAERVGVSRQAVSRWESNSAKPDADKILAICDLFAVSADYILRDEQEKQLLSVKDDPSERKFTSSQNEALVMESGKNAVRLSILLFLVLLALSRMFPATVITLEREYYAELLGFLMYHDILWLGIVDVVLFVAGCIMAYGTVLWRRYKRMMLGGREKEKKEK